MQEGKPMASSNLCILTGSLGHKTGSREGAPVCVCSHPIYAIFCISNHHHTLQKSLKRLLKIDKHVYMSVRSLDSHAKWPHWYCSKADNSDRRFVLCQTPLAVQISVFVSVACGLMGAEAKCRTQFDGKPWQKYCPESENGRKGPIILTHSLQRWPIRRLEPVCHELASQDFRLTASALTTSQIFHSRDAQGFLI